MRGIDVTLYVRTQTGVDSFNSPVFAEAAVVVPNVLVGEPSSDDINSSISLYGKRIDYVLGIPKGDEHQWEDCKVAFLGKTFRTVGNVIEGIEANVPTPWHKKVRVERFG